MRIRAFLFPVLGGLAPWVSAQEHALDNLVPNPGFEEFTQLPTDWFYTGSDFTRVMRYWESPTGASPDVYGPKIYVPKNWRDKGFGQGKPHGGHSMVGITVYGCHGGKPHCREYVQTQLYEPLVLGQRYEVSYWVRSLPVGFQINNLGVAFSDQRFQLKTDDQLYPDFVIRNEYVLSPPVGQWLKCKREFTAESDAGYLVIGNFNSDEETAVSENCPDDCLHFSYYYLDDVVLKKLPPILPVPVPPDDLSKITLTQGETIRLNYIFFDSGKSDFLPRSYHELNTLLGLMLDHPHMVIEVHGHCDILGTDEYNTKLSVERAKHVVDYLVAHRIDPSRVSYQGFGNTKPIGDNDTELGRSKNRRVEFKVIRL